MEKKKIEYSYSSRKSVNAKLSDFDYLAKDHDFIEVTAWTNHDGVDVTITDKTIQLTFGEIDAIKKLTKKLIKEIYKKNEN
jgi:hypothetical protein